MFFHRTQYPFFIQYTGQHIKISRLLTMPLKRKYHLTAQQKIYEKWLFRNLLQILSLTILSHAPSTAYAQKPICKKTSPVSATPLTMHIKEIRKTVLPKVMKVSEKIYSEDHEYIKATLRHLDTIFEARILVMTRGLCLPLWSALLDSLGLIAVI